jgi:hypothetical protein
MDGRKSRGNKKAALQLARLQALSKSRLLGLHFDDRLALIGATFRADVMCDVILATVLAYHQMLKRQRIMGTAVTPAAARRLSFW